MEGSLDHKDSVRGFSITKWGEGDKTTTRLREGGMVA